MIIYMCIKFESNILIFSKDIAQKPLFKVENFSKVKKGHNSQNNWWILPLIELDIQFMIIDLCIKFQSNTPIFSKDIAQKPFVLCTWRGHKNGPNYKKFISLGSSTYQPIIKSSSSHSLNTLKSEGPKKF